MSASKERLTVTVDPDLVEAASAAVAEGLAQADVADPVAEVHAAMWEPVYPEIEAV